MGETMLDDEAMSISASYTLVIGVSKVLRAIKSRVELTQTYFPCSSTSKSDHPLMCRLPMQSMGLGWHTSLGCRSKALW